MARSEKMRGIRIGRGALVACVALALAQTFGAAPAFGRTIRLAAGQIDTAARQSATSATYMTQNDDGQALVLVQLDGPIKRGWRETLEGAVVAVHYYVPDYAYLVTIELARIDSVRQLSFVEWMGEMPAGLKVHPRVQTRMHQMARSGRSYPPDPGIDVTVLSVDPDVAKTLEAWGYNPTSSRRSRVGWIDTRVNIPASRLGELSQWWSVFHIGLQPRYELRGERAAQTAAGNYAPGAVAPTGPGYVAFLASHGLSGGPGLVAQVQDDGLDQGDASNLPGTAHPDILGRIAGIFNATSNPFGNSRDGHGQINAGIIMANASVGTTDLDGYLLGQGMAPQAQVYATKIFRNGGAFDTGIFSFSDLAKNAEDAGVILSNNSWGADTGGAYTADSAEFDLLTRDADSTEPGNQPLSYFFAAGNAGPLAGSIGSPASAKNVIAVGAAENSDADGIDGCGVPTSGADSLRDLIGFSSRGPNQDGRLGVTLVSVGTHNQGPASTDPTYNGSGVCDQFWPLGQTDYARSSGTSHSTPTAAGAALVVHELFQTQLAALGHPASPSPALMKAILTATATDLAGGNDGTGGVLASVPSVTQGWGSVNLRTLLDRKLALTTVDQSVVFDGSGQFHDVQITAVNPAEPVRIALAWTDAPALPSANPVLVNDLDLVVTHGVHSFLGNVFAGGFSVTGGATDVLNNLESVYIANPGTGPIDIRVSASNIAGDGIPSTGSSTDQDFALFVLNGMTQTSAGFVSITEDEVACDASAALLVSDADLQGAGTVSIALSTAAGDSESISLAEQGSTGVFVATLPTSSGPVTISDAVLQIADGGSLTAAYQDADDGTGTPVLVQDSAIVDCVTPSISNVQTTALGSLGATITFDTSEPSLGSVEFGSSCAALSQSQLGAADETAHAIAITGLAPDSTFFYRVTGSDPAGNTAIDDNGGTCFSFTTLAQPDFFTELFSGADNDLAFSMTTLTPDGSPDGYTACRQTAMAFPTDPTGGTPLVLNDDDSQLVSISGGKSISLYGVPYTSFFVGSNGYLTFDASDTDFSESLADHFAQPRVSVLFDDFDPKLLGTVSSKQLADRIAVTWDGVPQYGSSDANSFQVELFFDGRIRLSHLSLAAQDGLVGLSEGLGLSPAFVETDFSVLDPCVFSAGSVSITPDPFFCGASISISLLDSDLAGAGTASVDLSTAITGDVEAAFVLTETGPATGSFSESIASVESGAATVGDGVLQVSEGDLVTAQYADADDGTGQPAIATATASAQCLVQGINLSFENGFSGWVPTDLANPFLPLQVSGAGVTPAGFGFFSSAPTDGLLAALHGFDGAGPGLIQLTNDLVLSATADSVEFDYRAAWDLLSFGATLDRTFRVEIQPVGGGAPLQSDLLLTATAGTANPDTGDFLGSVDVSAFVGQAIRLVFLWDVPENYSGPAFFQLDNVVVVGIPTIEVSGFVTAVGAPLLGVVMNGLPGTPATAGSGFYTATLTSPFSGSVAPSLPGFYFVPSTRSYAAVGVDQLAQDFVGFPIVGTPLTVDFEGPDPLFGWAVADGGGAPTDLWHATPSCASLLPGHSAPGSLYFGLDASCDFDLVGQPVSGTATSPVYERPLGGSEVLSFRYFLGTELAAPTLDAATVELSAGGGPFETVAANFPTPGGELLQDGTGVWQTAVIPLASILLPGDSTIQLRFGFDSVDASANDFPGFYVDDVVVTTSNPPLVPGLGPIGMLALFALLVGTAMAWLRPRRVAMEEG